MQEQCQGLGIDIDRLIPPEAVEESRGQEDFEVWPENWDAVRLFVACGTQWIVHLGLRGLYFQGMDFGRAGSIAREWLHMEVSEALFWQLRTLEDEIKSLVND